jgi:type VI protein secretion system component Hcp
VPTYYFLKIGLRPGSGIAGESMKAGFEGWIEIELFAPVLPHQLGGGGGGPGKVQVNEFSFSKRVDRTSSQLLFSASHAGTHFDGAIFAIEGPGTPMWFQFEDVQIANFRHEQHGSVSIPDVHAESFKISYHSVQSFAGRPSIASLLGPGAVRPAKAALTAAALTIASALAPSSAPVVAAALRGRTRGP